MPGGFREPELSCTLRFFTPNCPNRLAVPGFGGISGFGFQGPPVFLSGNASINGEAEMGRFAGIALVAAVCAAPAGADWVHGMMIEECSRESRELLAGSVRRDIERSVRRAEASMEPPASIGDLGCLDGLMDVNIDVFAPVGPLSSLFSNSLDGLLAAPGKPRRICRFAHRKWNEVSRPLMKPLDLLQLGLPPDFAGSFNAVAEVVAADANGAPAGRAVETRAGSPDGPSGPETESGRRPAGGFDPVGNIWKMLYGEGKR